MKETEQKLDKLVNAFLDGIIEKDTYLAKMNSSKPKLPFWKEKAILGERETIGLNH